MPLGFIKEGEAITLSVNEDPLLHLYNFTEYLKNNSDLLAKVKQKVTETIFKQIV